MSSTFFSAAAKYIRALLPHQCFATAGGQNCSGSEAWRMMGRGRWSGGEFSQRGSVSKRCLLPRPHPWRSCRTVGGDFKGLVVAFSSSALSRPSRQETKHCVFTAHSIVISWAEHLLLPAFALISFFPPSLAV